jgi:hypothetical protein
MNAAAIPIAISLSGLPAVLRAPVSPFMSDDQDDSMSTN